MADGRVRCDRRGALGLVAACFATGLGADGALAAVPRRATKVLVLKRERRLYLLKGPAVLASYRVALGRQPRGTKIYQGDGRTPEGSYVLDGRNERSRFYRSLHISYPNAADRVRAAALGQRTGSAIMIHGLPAERPGWGGEHWRFNWTNGCIAVDNQEMDEIWAAVPLGTPIEIRP